MLDARGNLDLESPDEFITSSGTPGRGPLWAYGFWALHSCIIVRDVFCMFFHVLLMEFKLHFGSMLVAFSMFFALLFRASILQGFVINFARIFIYMFEVFLLISMVLHPSGETIKNTCF